WSMTLAPSQSIPVVQAAQEKASSSSFYSAMRLMPKAEREAMFAIYGFCRLVDDIADDGVGTREERKAELLKWRVDLDDLYAGHPPERARFLVEPVKHYGLRRVDFLTVIDGMDMDVERDIVAPDLQTLDLYCERVASAVGRLSIKVFGMKEDAGIATRDPKAAIADPRIDSVCRLLARDAHGRYAKAASVLAKKPKGRIATPRLMGAVYGEILRQTEAVGWKPPRSRVSLGKTKLLGIVLRNGLFG